MLGDDFAFDNGIVSEVFVYKKLRFVCKISVYIICDLIYEGLFMKLQKIIMISTAIGIVSIVSGCMGNAAATYWDGKKYDILESHWGAPTEMQKNENGTSTAIFRAGGDCVATFNMDALGIITNHNIVGDCHYDAYNRLQNVEH